MMNWNGCLELEGSSVTITAPARQPLLADLESRMVRGEGFSVATLNLDHVVKLRRDAAFREAYLAQTHVTADGNPVVWFSRLAGDQVDLVPGSELVDPVAEIAARAGVKVALVGSTDASLEAAATVLKKRHPALEIVLTLAPPMGFDPTGDAAETVVARLRESGAGLCFLALGAPKQERFAAHARKTLPGVGFLSIGAGLDFLSGLQRRAPRLVRAMAAEWLWRLAGNPARFAGRYAACIALLPRLTVLALATRTRTRTRSREGIL